MRSIATGIFAAVLLIAAGGPVAAAEPVFAKAGDSLPEVSVRSLDGKELTIRSVVAKKPSVLIFYRGGWCPFCNRHLSAVAEIQDDLQAAGYQLIAISPDQPALLKKTIAKGKLGYTLLSDSPMALAKGLGITFRLPDPKFETYKKRFGIDLEAYSGANHHLLPHPAVFLVDTKGKIRFAHVNENYRVRLEPEKILAAARNSLKKD